MRIRKYQAYHLTVPLAERINRLESRINEKLCSIESKPVFRKSLEFDTRETVALRE
jgi:hypothetical protein